MREEVGCMPFLCVAMSVGQGWSLARGVARGPSCAKKGERWSPGSGMCGNDPAESVRARTHAHPAHEELGRDCGCVVGMRGKRHGRIVGSKLLPGQPSALKQALSVQSQTGGHAGEAITPHSLGFRECRLQL